MNSTQHKVAALSQRKSEIQRELSEIKSLQPGSENSALLDLEKALLAELDRLEDQLNHLKTFAASKAPQAADPQ